MNNTHCEIMDLGGGVTAIACGVPDKCEHDSDGPFLYEDKEGNVYSEAMLDLMAPEDVPVINSGYATCSKCGKPSLPGFNEV